VPGPVIPYTSGPRARDRLVNFGLQGDDVDAADLVREYLEAMEARDLARAERLLGPGFAMTFPGGRRFHALGELVQWAAGRYRRIHKHFAGFDLVRRGDTEVVYCHGVMHGEAIDGRPFAGVRFVDRFEIRGGAIVDQQVWNDLAECDVLAPAPAEKAITAANRD
jgi:hypothetical protein